MVVSPTYKSIAYLFFPFEWDDTIKLTGGSIMAEDSSFQDCLWFDHSSYSELPVDHLNNLRCKLWKTHNKKKKTVQRKFNYRSSPRSQLYESEAAIECYHLIFPPVSICHGSRGQIHHMKPRERRSKKILEEIRWILAGCMNNVSSLCSQFHSANTWTSRSSNYERNVRLLFSHPVLIGWSEIR